MPSFTSFLNLSLPAFGEFVDSWQEPVNQNFEDLDDWTDELHGNLVGAGVGSTWASLRGSMASLAARLDVSIDSFGNINVSTAQGILDMSVSAYRGTYSNSPRDRLNDNDREVYEARQPGAGDRFDPIGGASGFGHADLDAGMALRTADFSESPISSPMMPSAPGLVRGGAGTFMVGSGATGRVTLDAASSPAYFNLDGYIFRLREQLVVDFNALSALSANDYVWLYVERNEAAYGDAEMKYSEVGGTPVSKDLRTLRTGGAGTTTSPSTFVDGTATWDTAPYKAKEGDILRITSGAAAGDYVIDALDGGTPNIKLTIKGEFFAGGITAPYQIIDRSVPHIGGAIAVANPELKTSLPPYVEGRVYFGRCKNSGGSPTEVITFAKNGVYDSGWLAVDANADFPFLDDHELGVIPSRVEVWVREDLTKRAYRPLVRRQVLTNFDTSNTTVEVGDPKVVDLLFPSMSVDVSETGTTLRLLNTTVDPAEGPALFTDSSNTDQDVGYVRIVCWR